MLFLKTFKDVKFTVDGNNKTDVRWIVHTACSGPQSIGSGDRHGSVWAYRHIGPKTERNRDTSAAVS